MSCNHKGSLNTALEIIQAAKDSGADAVKIQVWSPDTMAIPGYKIRKGPWKGRELNELYREAHTPWKWLPHLLRESNRLNIELFASPFDLPSLDMLESYDIPRYKVASFEIVDLNLIKAIARTRKPMIISTGMATESEITIAIHTAIKYGCDDLTLLHCVSSYPTPINKANLGRMIRLNWHQYGLSDHSKGSIVPIAATALGAKVIEKHLALGNTTLDKFSLLPKEFKSMVQACRATALAMQETTTEEHSELKRSLYYTQDLPMGTILRAEHLKSARPALGMSAVLYDAVIGETLLNDVKENGPVLLAQ